MAPPPRRRVTTAQFGPPSTLRRGYGPGAARDGWRRIILPPGGDVETVPLRGCQIDPQKWRLHHSSTEAETHELQSAALNPGYDDKPESAPASKGESPTPSLQAALDAKTDAMKSSAREDDRYLSAQEQSSVLVKMCQQESARHPAVPLRVPRGLNPTPLKPFAMGELEAALRQVPCESVKAPRDARQESTAEHLQP
ncbi:hypothetical protein CGC21_29075 [Leishmania donovani]|uniref:Uncharacterized protein n=1 Tax=Leishmania donovani TaxID=5661 RepID=A0A504XXH8_LEIDO|nr:hypothetical protein CGC21_29015 [Leishmania donovani]TPP49849.1 hypothetical protein CGC21_29075 [Leishmania donovani]